MIENLIVDSNLNWKKRVLKRGESIIRSGEVEKNITFVVKGLLRAYLLTEEEEHTIRFAYKDSVISAIPSYFTNQPTELSIEALRETEVLVCKKVEFEKYVTEQPQLSLVYQEFLKGLVCSFFDREVDLLTKSPKIRYDRIRKRNPQVFQEVPHKYIASYLRMSPETLSRLMKS